MPYQFGGWLFVIPIVAIIGGFVITGLAIYSQIRRREFEHRERLAMIERGVAPPAQPARADADGILPTHSDVWGGLEDRTARVQRGGFIVAAVGLGVGFMLFMTSHDTDASLGIGGFFVILGLAIFASSFFGRSDRGRSSGPPARR